MVNLVYCKRVVQLTQLIEDLKFNHFLLQKVSYLDFPKYLFLMMAVTSRTFAVEINCQYQTCLIPIADMFNYNPSKKDQTVWYFDKDIKGFVIKSIENIERGQEVFVDYGEKSNWKLLLYYGFTIWPNYLNDIPFEVSVIHDCENANDRRKKSLLGMVYDSEIFLISRQFDIQFKKLLGFLRVAVYNGNFEELEILSILKYS